MSKLAIRRDVDGGAVPVSEPSQSGLSARLPAAVAALFTVAYAALFGWLSLQRYWSYQMHALDMGNMGQAAWNTVHGHPFYFTTMRLPYHGIEAWGTTTRLSFHVEALFPLIALTYVVYPHPESLLVLQTMALALGAIPVYLLARDVLGSRWMGTVFALVYLLFPSLEAMNLYEFHPVALATPLLLAAFLFLYRRQPLPFILCSLAAMGTKEEIGLVVALFGVYGVITRRLRWSGVAVAVLGVAWSLFASIVVEHHFRQPGVTTYFHSRYGYLGHGVRGALHTVFRDPGAIGQHVLIWPKLMYLRRLLLPVGFLALLSPLTLLLGAPTFLLNVFSTDSHMYSGLGHNSAELISVVMIAAILGAGWVKARARTWMSSTAATSLIAVYLLAAAFWSQRLDGFTPLGSAWQLPSIGAHQLVQDRFVHMARKYQPVSTQDQLNPHLSSAHDVYLFEDTGADVYAGAPLARSILLDASAPTYPLPSAQLYDRAQDRLRHGWGVAAADDGLLLLRRGIARRSVPSTFYRYFDATPSQITRPLHGSAGGLEVRGYSRERVDTVNNAVPNLEYSIYLQPRAEVHQGLQPVLFERMSGRLIGCTADPLGLNWHPTSQWRQGRLYRVRMQPAQTQTDRAGMARFYLEVTRTLPHDPGYPTCDSLWASHGRLWPVGALSVTF